MEDWYCFTGLCNKQVNNVKIESDIQDLTDIDELIDLDEINMDKINMDVSSSTNNMIDIQNTMEIIEGNENRYELYAPTFTGAMKGYAFKTGDEGLGYYIDQ